METKVSLKYSRISPKKARPVAQLIRNQKIDRAENILKFQTQKAAKILLKLLKSGIASAKEKDADNDKLYLKEIRVDQGPGLKRRKIRARGRADIIKKPTAHFTIILSDEKSKKPEINPPNKQITNS